MEAAQRIALVDESLVEPTQDSTQEPEESPTQPPAPQTPSDAAPPSASTPTSATPPAGERQIIKSAKAGQQYVRIQVPRVQSYAWQGNGRLHPQGADASAAPSAEQPGGAVLTEPPSAARPQGGVALPGMEHRVVVPDSTRSRYLRRELPHAGEFLPRGESAVEVSDEVLAPQSVVQRAVAAVRRTLLGRPLATAEQAFERLTKVKALAVLSSDAISSVAYATEASLAILIGVGVGAMQWNLPIAGAIALLMLVVGTSYQQTIHAYPHGGGSYIVARDNLGDWYGLVAAAALLIDYILTVSVSVSSGVDALTSAVTALHPYSVPLGVGFIAIIMVVNLRGVRESGTIFAAPTYLFICAFLIMIVTGLIHAALAPGGLFTAAAPHLPAGGLYGAGGLGWKPERLGLLLILTAFASGCSAMTGVEAISNGVPAFQPPEAKNASRTLVWMVGILVTLFLGITYLAWRFAIVPNSGQNPTVDSQIASLLFTGPFAWFYYVVQGSTLLILVLAANTSFADFPRLSSILARDNWLPHQFSYRGDRLAFSTGIIVLSILSTVLLIGFNGNTEALINLYALGVFTAFTLSQSGMVVRWRRLGRRGEAGGHWRQSMAINLVGALVTGLVMVIILVTKFDRGAWIVVLLVPVLVVMFRAVAHHYQAVREQTETLTPLQAEDVRHIMVVPVAELNRPALQSLAYARSLARDVIAVHLVFDADEETAFRAEWDRWVTRRQEVLALAAGQSLEESPTDEYAEAVAHRRRVAKLAEIQPQLVIIHSPYRSLVAPLIAYIDALRDANPQATTTVILPEFVPAHWWERLLHNQTAFRLKLALYSHPGVVVINVPNHLGR
jgi:amino acid transporter